MNPGLLRLLASLKIPACIAIGCGGTLTVQRYTASSSPSWDEKAATEKEGSGKGMKFEINQLSKQLEEKEQSLKTWEEMLAKQAADLKEQQQAVSSAPVQTTTVTTVAEPKPDQPVIDDVPFGEEDAKSGKLKASNIAQRRIAKKEAEAPAPDAPKRPAVFDGGGTPAVAFPQSADIVAIKETSDIPEKLQAELRTKDWTLKGLKERLELLEPELAEKDRQLSDLRTSNEDLKRELEETKKKLAKTEADAKGKFLRLEPENSIVLSCLRGGEWEDPEKRSEYLKNWLSQKKILPKGESFAVCRLKPKEASRLWYLFPPFKWMFDACLNNRRWALINKMARGKEVGSLDINECCDLVPVSMYVCATGDPREGMIVKKGKDRYSVRKPERWWFWLFCPCKRKANEIRKLKYEEAVVKVTSEEPQDSPKIPELFDRLDPEELRAFEQLEPAGIGKDKWTPLEVESTPKKSGIFGFFEGIGNYFNSFIGIMSAFDDGTEELQGRVDPAQFHDEDF